MKIPPAQIENYIKNIADQKIAGCLLFGPETSLAKYRFNIIAKKISPDLSDAFLVSNLSKERLSEDKGILADEFFSMSMMGGRKLITAQDSDQAVTGALKILFEDEKFAEKSENFLLIQAGDLTPASPLRKMCEANPSFAVIACYEDNENVIRQFISGILNKREIKFNVDVINLMLEKFGKNRQIILSELGKIITYLGDSKELTVEIVEKLTGSEADISANEFVMSFASQQFDTALIKAEKLFKNGFEPIALTRFLSNYTQKLYNAKALIESGEASFEQAIKNQRLFFKVEADFRKHISQLSLNYLIKILRHLEELETKMKSGAMPPKLAFTAFVQVFLAQKINLKKY